MATASTTMIKTSSIPPSLIPLFLTNKLGPLLPYPLPLYRRCQFFLRKFSSAPSQTSSSSPPASDDVEPGQEEVWVAVAESASQADSEDWLTTWLNTPEASVEHESSSNPTSSSSTKTSASHSNGINTARHGPWLAALIDIKEPGQTQVWVFGSWEPLFPSLSLSESTSASPPPTTPTPLEIALGRALVHRLRTYHIPSLPTTSTPQYRRLVDEGKVITQPYLRSRALFGTVAEASWWLLSDDVVKSTAPLNINEKTNRDMTTTVPNVDVNRNTAITRVDRPYLKYLFRLPLPRPLPSTSTATTTTPILETIAGPLTTTHLQTMLDRSPIPRTLETLQSLTTIGLFLPSYPHQQQQQQQQQQPQQVQIDDQSSPDPIAWGMIGKDASISSLHTEDGHRGRGLAVKVVRNLVAAQRHVFRTLHGAEDTEIDEVTEEEEVPWAHTDVSMSNVASRRVFEKMGAKVWWRVGWIEVDLDEV